LIRECIAKDPEERIRAQAMFVAGSIGIARGDDTVATATASPAKSNMARTV
jgi:hypothetical protein